MSDVTTGPVSSESQGQIVHQTHWLRPWPTVAILRDAAIAGQLTTMPAGFWLLPAAPARCPRPAPRATNAPERRATSH
jgi:hypothetical protein